jgi:hypothetical protein
MATPEAIDQQRRVVTATREDVTTLLNILTQLNGQTATYNRLGLSDDQILDDEAFVGTGTDKAAYRAAITSLGAIDTLLAAGHGTNLEKFAR